jgi:hypothetical protein
MCGETRLLAVWAVALSVLGDNDAGAKIGVFPQAVDPSPSRRAGAFSGKTSKKVRKNAVFGVLIPGKRLPGSEI